MNIAILHLEASALLAGGADSAAVARRIVGDRLRDWGLTGAVEDARTVTSELVTNAVVHAGGPAGLWVGVLGDQMRIEVADSSAVMLGADTAWGMGLTIVDRLSLSWGARPHADGKVVWSELGLAAGSWPAA